MQFRIGTTDEPMLQVSKWLKVPTLLDGEEMANLISSLGSFFIVSTGTLVDEGEGIISLKSFIENYNAYPAALAQGQIPNESQLRQIIPCVWSSIPDALYTVPVEGRKQVIRVSSPVIQLQHHKFDYSSIDGNFRSMVLGQGTILWGVQFSYPQLYEKPGTHEIIHLNDREAYANTDLFRNLQKWVRHNTIATPFLVNGKITNVPIRLGKNCLGWIHHHPQLHKKNLKVSTYAS